VNIEMKVVSMTHRESLYGTYVSPEVNVVAYWSQGVLCSSVGAGHDGFEDGGEYDL
jgi:hypothetical protein